MMNPASPPEGCEHEHAESFVGTATPVPVERLLAESFEKVAPSELLATALANVLHAATPGSHYVWAEVSSRYNVVRYQFSTACALAEWLSSSGALDKSSLVLSFVYSLVLTRGPTQLQADMDEVVALVGVFGHCSQELVNLCLTGRAVTNVFDGDVTFEDGDDILKLQGVQGEPAFGFLSALEPLKLCEVGRLLKRPRYPIWVVGTSSHYSLFFSADCRVNHVAVPGETPDEAGERFCCNACQGSRGETPVSKAFLFNGRDLGPDKPTLFPIDLQHLDAQAPQEAGPVLAGDHDTRLFAELLRTRWPGVEVSYLEPDGITKSECPPRIN